MDDELQDLLEAWQNFSRDMAVRLREKYDQGRRGWNDPETYPDEDLDADIENAFERYLLGDTDEVNVANYLLFRHVRNNPNEAA